MGKKLKKMQQSSMKKNSEVFARLNDTVSSKNLIACYQILVKLFNNIVQKPGEQKFRTIKSTNPKIAATVFSVNGVEEILHNLGFVFENGDYVFGGNNVADIGNTVLVLEARLSMLTAPTSTADPEILKKNNEMLAQQKARDDEIRKAQEAKFGAARIDKEPHLRDKPLQESVGNQLAFGRKDITVEFKSQSRGG